ncbi:MAG: MarR family transcriptional regulator [Clostridiales bacterium]|nr:MarR family transcriptional regulator [Clostridiales bacterium]
MDHQLFTKKMKILLKSVYFKMTASLIRVYEPYNLTPPQAGILSLLIECKQGKVSDLGTKLHTADSNISAICSRLEKRKLVERRRDEKDQRIVYIMPTPQAYELMKRIEIEKHERQKLLLDAEAITEEDMLMIIKAFERLDELLDLSERLERIRNRETTH